MCYAFNIMIPNFQNSSNKNKGSTLTFSALGGRGKEKNQKLAAKNFASRSEGARRPRGATLSNREVSNWRRRWDLNPRTPFRVSTLAPCRTRPLCDSSWFFGIIHCQNNTRKKDEPSTTLLWCWVKLSKHYNQGSYSAQAQNESFSLCFIKGEIPNEILQCKNGARLGHCWALAKRTKIK